MDQNPTEGWTFYIIYLVLAQCLYYLSILKMKELQINKSCSFSQMLNIYKFGARRWVQQWIYKAEESVVFFLMGEVGMYKVNYCGNEWFHCAKNNIT